MGVTQKKILEFKFTKIHSGRNWDKEKIRAIKQTKTEMLTD